MFTFFQSFYYKAWHRVNVSPAIMCYCTTCTVNRQVSIISAFSQPLNHCHTTVFAVARVTVILLLFFSEDSLCMCSSPDICWGIWYFTVIILSKVFTCNMIPFKLSSVSRQCVNKLFKKKAKMEETVK